VEPERKRAEPEEPGRTRPEEAAEEAAQDASAQQEAEPLRNPRACRDQRSSQGHRQPILFRRIREWIKHGGAYRIQRSGRPDALRRHGPRPSRALRGARRLQQ
jgi:hypothetical protein